MNARSSSAKAVSNPAKRVSKTGSGVRAATSEAILRAAEAVFADSGLRDAHMSAIAARAGMAVGTLYNHFEDREALLDGLLALRRRELLDRLDAALAVGSGDFRARLTRVAQAYFDYFTEHRPFFYILLEGEIGACAAMREEIYRRLERLVRRGARDGSLRADPELATAMLMGMLRALKMRDFYTRGSGPISVEKLVDFFFHGAA